MELEQGFVMVMFDRERGAHAVLLPEHSKPEPTGAKHQSLLFGVTTNVWELQNSYEELENRRNKRLLNTWTVLNVRWLILFMRGDNQAWVLLHPSFHYCGH